MLDGRRMLTLCSNNYLGLANDPRLILAAKSVMNPVADDLPQEEPPHHQPRIKRAIHNVAMYVSYAIRLTSGRWCKSGTYSGHLAGTGRVLIVVGMKNAQVMRHPCPDRATLDNRHKRPERGITELAEPAGRPYVPAAPAH